MTGQMIEFESNGAPAPGFLARPDAATGPGVVVLHAWWGLTAPVRLACDRLAAAGFIALAPDLYRGKTTASVDEAGALGSALDQNEEQWRGDIRGALRYLRQNGATSQTNPSDGRGAFGLLGFSLGGAYALDLSVDESEEVAAVVVFYDAYPGLDYHRARAAYLCHYAEDDTFVPTETAAQMERELRAAGKRASVYTYPGTKHSFVEANRPDAYDADAAALAWERTLAFLRDELPQA